MALTTKETYLGLSISGNYIRPEVFSRAGPTDENGGKPYQSVVKVYASKDATSGGAYRDFNCPFVQAPGQSLEAACYAALKEREDMAGAVDC